MKRFTILPVYKNGRLVILNMFVHLFYHLVIDLFTRQDGMAYNITYFHINDISQVRFIQGYN